MEFVSYHTGQIVIKEVPNINGFLFGTDQLRSFQMTLVRVRDSKFRYRRYQKRLASIGT